MRPLASSVAARRALAPILLLTVALGACGGDDASTEQAAVRDTAKRLYSSFADRDAGKICDLLTSKQRAAVAKGGGTKAGASCEQVMGVALAYVGGKGLEDADQAQVTKVTVDGDRATATVDFKGSPGVLGLAKEDGDWKISNFNPKKL
jgi:hypothetical protein